MPQPVIPPIYLSTTFHRGTDGTYEKGYIYTRTDNPNRRALEASLAEQEGGSNALAFASGMAAIHALFQSLRPGDEVLLPDDIYYNVHLLAQEVLSDWGLIFTTVDFSDLEAVKKAISSTTRLCYLESPSNPQLKITDLQAVSSIAKEHGLLVAVDSTWATPILQRPLELGADYVIHSCTKYFGGHSDVLGGALIVKTDDARYDKLRAIQQMAGAVPSPLDCWLISRGLQTLPLRIKAQSASAYELANFLSEHPGINAVRYPGLPTHPGHEIAARQMKGGFGAMLAVLIKGDATRTNAVAHRLKHFIVATSLGGLESLVEHRQSVEGPTSVAPPNLLRVSIGIEPIEQLIDDWAQALDF